MIEDSRSKTPSHPTPPDKLAQLLYEAYGKAQNWERPSGEILPDWSRLSEEPQKAWLHLAKMAIAAASDASLRVNDVTGEQLYVCFQYSLVLHPVTGRFTIVPSQECYPEFPIELQSAWDSAAEAFNRVVRGGYAL